MPHRAVARSNVIDNVRCGEGIGSVTGRPLGHPAQGAQWSKGACVVACSNRPVLDAFAGRDVAWEVWPVWCGSAEISKCLPSVASEYQVRVKFRS